MSAMERTLVAEKNAESAKKNSYNVYLISRIKRKREPLRKHCSAAAPEWSYKTSPVSASMQ